MNIYFTAVLSVFLMELCGLTYVASLPQPYYGPRHEVRRTVRLDPAPHGNAKWISNTMLLLKDIVTDEFRQTDLTRFNAFTSRLTDLEPCDNDDAEEKTTTTPPRKMDSPKSGRAIEMTIIVTLCFIDPGG